MSHKEELELALREMQKAKQTGHNIQLWKDRLKELYSQPNQKKDKTPKVSIA